MAFAIPDVANVVFVIIVSVAVVSYTLQGSQSFSLFVVIVFVAVVIVSLGGASLEVSSTSQDLQSFSLQLLFSLLP